MAYPKNIDLWLPAYLRSRMGRFAGAKRPAKRLWVAMTDHFEPLGGKVSLDIAHARVDTWKQRWPAIALAAPKDAEGRAPCFTFFYPQEEYDRTILNSIAELCQSSYAGHTGLADVEVHLHHDHDTADAFREKVSTFCARLRNDHGLLHEHNGRLVFGFIHGNWALDNSRPDGRWCGVSGELQVLRDLGCYADFTMPSLPSATQSRILNKIYWTTGDPAKPRGFDSGVEVTPAGGRHGDLLMITGPTGLRFRDRLVPRIETGELAHYDAPSPYRVERWLDLAPRIGDDIFVKLYGHSAREDNAAALLGANGKPGTLASMFDWIHQAARRLNVELHWASAFQMFQAVERLIAPTKHQIQPSTLESL